MKTQSKTLTIANVVTKHSISSELARKMVNEAMAKASQLGVAENVAILDDGGNLKAFGRMDGAPILCIEMAQNKAYTALIGVSTQDFFNFIQGDPSLLAGIPTLARVAAWGGGFPIKVNGEVVGAIGGERGAYGAERHRLRESGPRARTRRNSMNTQVVLITGGLTGIGRATALAFANEGAQVAVSGRHDEEGQKLVGEIRKRGWPMKSSPVERRSE
jgi:uncharacterized protein GlcG (DUF336 family)